MKTQHSQKQINKWKKKKKKRKLVCYLPLLFSFYRKFTVKEEEGHEVDETEEIRSNFCTMRIYFIFLAI